MKLTKIELKDWGPHANLSLNTDDPIVGIIGRNGAGKSNLLQAIIYAMTGNLNKRQGTSYIRNFGNPDGADKASVYIEFRAAGKNGSIYREIGAKSTRRRLVWDGAEYTRAEDVKRLMREIMGTDEAALMNAAFIQQGETANMVKGTPGERYDTFRKLVSLNFLEARANDLNAKIAVLRAGIKDFGGERDLVVEMLEKLNAELVQLEAERANYADLDTYVTAATDMHRAIQTANEAQQRLSQLVAEEIEQRESYASFTARNPEGLEALEKQIAEKRDELAAATALLNAVSEYKSCSAMRKSLQVDKDTQMSELEAYKQDAVELEKQLEADIVLKNLDLVKDTAAAATAYESLVSDIQSKRLRVELLTDAVEEATDAVKLATPKFKEERTRISAIKTKLLLKRDQVKMKRTMLETGEVSTCPCCGAPMHLGQDDTLENLENLDDALFEEIQDIETEYDENEENFEKLCLARHEAEGRLSAAKQVLETAEAGFVAAEAEFVTCKQTLLEVLPNYTLDSNELWKLHDTAKAQGDGLRKELASNKSMQKAIERNLETTKSRLETAQERLTDLIIEHPGLATAEIDNGKIDTLTGELATMMNDQSLATDIRSKLERLAAAKEKQQNAIKLNRERERDLWQKHDFVTFLTHTVMKDYCDITEPNGDAEKGDYLLRQCRAAEYALTSINQTIYSKEQERRSVDEKLAGIDERIAQNQERLELIQKLESVREVVGKNGAPMSYMETVFEGITDTVQELLANMGANFTVEPDPENPVTYTFTRNDNDSGYTMAQEQLSGGQAIRLALAMLIAAQQLILPDVGLLILDEPSSHVDTEGVAQMRDMFKGLAAFLQSADMQIIMVDHNEMLIGAVDNTITL